jgi:Zn-dependent M28 family amino/carboxypeptidase
MHRAKAFLIFSLVALPVFCLDFSGESAMTFARKAVSFGPRPPASPAIRSMQTWIIGQLRAMKYQVSEDDFKGDTPLGAMPMKNIIARRPGSSGRSVVITGHYDTKLFPGRHFVGANDGGSSAALLLEMARVVATRTYKDDVVFVWFDGEEAIGEWSAVDGVHGSRHLAAKWSMDGALARVKALINVDMIGDKDLGILEEMNSSEPLRRLVWQVAKETGYGKYFLDYGGPIEDDHMPFLKRGVNSLDLIDFDYGPNNKYWHTDQDTIDKISAHSLEVVGNVLLEVLRRLSA